MLKKQNGVTLVALVITIIVLLILAGVTLAMVVGDNGIFTKANEASSKTTKTSVIDAVGMALLEAQTETYTEANNYSNGFLYANLPSDTVFESSLSNSGFTKDETLAKANQYKIDVTNVSTTDGKESGEVIVTFNANAKNTAFEVKINAATGAITTPDTGAGAWKE